MLAPTRLRGMHERRARDGCDRQAACVDSEERCPENLPFRGRVSEGVLRGLLEAAPNALPTQILSRGGACVCRA